MCRLRFALFVFLSCGSALFVGGAKPNIIVIVADDIGWNDVGFHGSDEIPTPNIDALAYNGVILNSHYTQCMCTPSRSAFLTGKYPIHIGMQHTVILEPEPWGLGLNETLLPRHLQKNGYATHAIGKWHLGFFRKEYTPTYRGFDSHFGYWQGFQDYYTHDVHASLTDEMGYDMRRNMSVDWDAKGKYSTELFTEEAVKLIRGHDAEKPMFMYLAHLAVHTGNAHDPLQAPDEEVAKFAHIVDPERRIYAAMVSMLDRSVGKVVAALRETKMLDNTIVLFIGDNGAQTVGIHANHGSNYPLRGMKQSSWEGGMRGVAAIWSPLIKKPQRVSNNLMHITDWLPTFYSAAGLNASELGIIDGVDMWKTISENVTSPRTEFVYNMDDVDDYVAIRDGDWKYMRGTTYRGKYDSWYGSSGKDELYNYDETAVLKSQTATALAGFITSEQIREKHANEKNENDFSIRLLNAESMRELRESATLRCPVKIDAENFRECKPLEAPCLFNLKDDPCETTNVYAERPDVVAGMMGTIAKFRKTAIKPRNVPRDPNADPVHWNNTWVPWHDCLETKKQELERQQFWSPVSIGLVSAAAVIFFALLLVTVVRHAKTNKFPKMLPVSTKYEDAMEPRELHHVFKDQAFVDHETTTHNSFKDPAKSIE